KTVDEFAIEEPKWFQCEHCSKIFDNKNKLAVHKYHVHGPRKSCGICNKSFANASHLNQHVMSVHEKVSFACDQCGKRFKRRSNIIHHKKTIHEGERRFPCSGCDMRFATKQHLD